jgi:hypothetical protein
MAKKRTEKASGGPKRPAGTEGGAGAPRPGPKKPPRVPKEPPLPMAMTIAGAGKELKLGLSPDPVTAYNVDVNGEPIYFVQGKAARPIAPGNHTLSWAIEHTPGVVVTIKITAPPEAVWEEARVMPPEGRWDGVHEFYVYA